MGIWFFLAIPLLSIPVLCLILQTRFCWRIFTGSILIQTGMLCLLSICYINNLTSDTERHGGWVTKVTYYEPWNEWIDETCSQDVNCGQDCTTTIYYDCSYVSHHEAEYELSNSNGDTITISQQTFEELGRKFSNMNFVELNRNFHTIDGNAYISQWQGEEETFQPFFTEHRYTNRAQVSDVKKFTKFTKEESPQILGLYDFPNLTNNFYDPAILGDAPNKEAADKLLQNYNAKYGRSKQVRFWVLLFKNKAQSIGFDQESYWKGGNKNEIVVCIGLDDQNQVEWCRPFCWSPENNISNEIMLRNIQTHIEKQTQLNLVESVDFLVKEAVDKFERKQFKELSKVAINLPQTLNWLAFVIVIVFTFITGFAITQKI